MFEVGLARQLCSSVARRPCLLETSDSRARMEWSQMLRSGDLDDVMWRGSAGGLALVAFDVSRRAIGCSGITTPSSRLGQHLRRLKGFWIAKAEALIVVTSSPILGSRS
ncbi:hypothetical protein BC834DRAFT_876251 [Gloeopeniophorella convolvens]|nr:hypothetical protein BC834DRAFT_876251 [Gloeopeniophorella convolvens]